MLWIRKGHLSVGVVPSTHFHVPSSSVSVSPIQMLPWNFLKKSFLHKQKWILTVNIDNDNKFPKTFFFCVCACQQLWTLWSALIFWPALDCCLESEGLIVFADNPLGSRSRSPCWEKYSRDWGGGTPTPAGNSHLVWEARKEGWREPILR